MTTRRIPILITGCDVERLARHAGAGVARRVAVTFAAGPFRAFLVEVETAAGWMPARIEAAEGMEIETGGFEWERA